MRWDANFFKGREIRIRNGVSRDRTSQFWYDFWGISSVAGSRPNGKLHAGNVVTMHERCVKQTDRQSEWDKKNLGSGPFRGAFASPILIFTGREF